MVNLRTAALLAVMFAAFPLAATAQSAERARELLDLLGFDVAASAVSDAFMSEQNVTGGFSPEVREAWPEIVAGKFQVEALMEASAQAVSAALSEQDFATLTAFYSQGLGARVTALEKAAQDPARSDEVAADVQSYIATLGEDFKPRFALFREMADALQAVDTQVAFNLNVGFAMFSGMAASGKMPVVPSDDEVLAMLAQQEPAIRAAITQHTNEMFAYTYRDLTDQEIKEYLDFLKTAPAIAFYTAVSRATTDVVIRDVRALGREIMMQAEKQKL